MPCTVYYIVVELADHTNRHLTHTASDNNPDHTCTFFIDNILLFCYFQVRASNSFVARNHIDATIIIALFCTWACLAASYVNKVNADSNPKGHSVGSTVTIVDPPGVEVIESNHFPQLCRNFACEALNNWFAKSYLIEFQASHDIRIHLSTIMTGI